MKKLAIALGAVAALTAPAFAADLPVRTPVAAPAPVAYAPSWTGCYVGGGGGHGLWNQENTGFIDGPPRVPFTATTTAGGRGYLGAVGGGCDYQFPVGAGTSLSARSPTMIGAALRASSIPPLPSVWSATRRRAQLGRWAAVSAGWPSPAF